MENIHKQPHTLREAKVHIKKVTFNSTSTAPPCLLEDSSVYGFQFPAHKVLEISAAFFRNLTLIYLCVYIICGIIHSNPSVMVGVLPKGDNGRRRIIGRR